MNSSSSTNARKRRRPRAPPPPLSPSSGFNSTTFPLLLAAAANLQSPHPRSLIKRALRSHLLLLTPPTPSLPLHRILPRSLLSLLPLLLTSRFPSVSELAVEVIGAAGLYSLEGNSAVASDRAVVEGLVRVLGRRGSVEAACHAVMDLATSAVGRDRLRDSFALEKLLWEGFAHIALNCWNEKQNPSCPLLTDYKSRKRRVMFINLLHVGVKLIADRDPVFRKACMVAALPLSCNTEVDRYAHALMLNEKATFTSIIDTISLECIFTEAFRSMETVVLEKNYDSLQWLKWLRHLPHTEDEIKGADCDNLMGVFEDLVRLYYEHTEEVMIEFNQVKSEFCKQVNYEDASQSFKVLLEKYRKTRKQYMKGMLSLHST